MVTYFDTCYAFQHSNLILVAVSYSLTISLQFFFSSGKYYVGTFHKKLLFYIEKNITNTLLVVVVEN